MATKATCSECGLVTKIKYKTHKYGNGLEETFFKCRNCHVKYTCFVTDRKTRKLIKESNKLRDKGENKTAADIAVINENQKYIDAKITELTNKRRKEAK